MNWTLKKIKVNELKEYSKNPRQLTKKGLEHLENSIKKFGVAEPLVINTDNTICGGHGRKKILQRLNISEVDCYVPEQQLTDKQFQELNIRLNKNVAGEFDFDILANEFETEDLIDWGFDEYEIGIDMEMEFPENITNEKGISTMEFTLSESQVETVKGALKKVKRENDFSNCDDNKNSNGNALYKICCLFLNES